MRPESQADIIIIGGGAAGLMAAVGAASVSEEHGRCGLRVIVLEKMPRVGRKIMISGKGRCNFTNMSEWSEFATHIHPKADFLKPAFYSLTPGKMISLIEAEGCPCTVERGDRVFPETHRSADIVDALLAMAEKSGAEVIAGCRVTDISANPDGGFTVSTENGEYSCRCLIITTGGLSYPATGSTGDGLVWARKLGHRIEETFPSLTAIVPKGYKKESGRDAAGGNQTSAITGNIAAYGKGHIDRAVPLSEWGGSLCGIALKNVRLGIEAGGNPICSEFGDLDFTDGGIEGPIGFKVSRKTVKAVMNGAKVTAHIDLKPAVEPEELEKRIDGLWKEITDDRRSSSVVNGRRVLKPYKDRFTVLLTRLLPKELIRPFAASNPGVDSRSLGKALKDWKLPVAGYVGYERCVVTAGGVALDGVNKKDMQSKTAPGLFFAGEVLDLDGDTGGYNLHTAFCTGHLAGAKAAERLQGLPER